MATKTGLTCQLLVITSPYQYTQTLFYTLAAFLKKMGINKKQIKNYSNQK